MSASLTGDEVRSIDAAQVDSYDRQQGSSRTPISIHSSSEGNGDEDKDWQDSTTVQEGGGSRSEDADCDVDNDSDSSSEEVDGSQAGSTYEPDRPAKKGKKVKGKKKKVVHQPCVDARKQIIKRHCGPCDRCTLDGFYCISRKATVFGEKCQPCFERRQTDPPCHHRHWLQQHRVAQWDALIRRGCSYEGADCIVYGKLDVFAHETHDLVKPAAYLRVDPKIRAEFCGPEFARRATGTTQLAPASPHHIPNAVCTASNVNMSELGSSHGLGIVPGTSSGTSDRHISPVPEHRPRKRNADEAELTPAVDSHPTHNTPALLPGTPMPSEASVRQAWADIEPPADVAALSTRILRGYKTCFALYGMHTRSTSLSPEEKSVAMMEAIEEFMDLVAREYNFRANFTDTFGESSKTLRQ